MNQLQSDNQTALAPLSSHLKKICTRLPPVEALLIQRKYSAPAIGKLTPLQRMATGKHILIQVCVITGWNLPKSSDPKVEEHLQNALFDQMAKYLLEMWPTLNHEEIEYAFRTKSSNVKDWGKAINLSLFTEVLEPYLIERKAASEREAQAALKLENENSDLPFKMSNEELIETAFQIWQGMKNWEFIMVGAWDAIKAEKLFPLTKEEQLKYLSASKAIAAQKEDKDRDFFKGIDKDFWLKCTAGKLATNKYFETLKP